MGLFPIFSTRVLPTFLESVKGCGKPAILDIGPVIGHNIEFLLGRGMKVYVEDVLTDWEELNERRIGADDTPLPVGEYLEKQLAYPTGFFDGILCRDTLDGLDPPSSRLLIRQLHGILKHGGPILALFGGGERWSDRRAKSVITDGGPRKSRWPSTSRPYHQYENRHIHDLFSNFGSAHSYLLGNGIRAILCRKEAPSAA